MRRSGVPQATSCFGSVAPRCRPADMADMARGTSAPAAATRWRRRRHQLLAGPRRIVCCYVLCLVALTSHKAAGSGAPHSAADTVSGHQDGREEPLHGRIELPRAAAAAAAAGRGGGARGLRQQPTTDDSHSAGGDVDSSVEAKVPHPHHHHTTPGGAQCDGPARRQIEDPTGHIDCMRLRQVSTVL